jgi:hypothetical protein
VLLGSDEDRLKVAQFAECVSIETRHGLILPLCHWDEFCKPSTDQGFHPPPEAGSLLGKKT